MSVWYMAGNDQRIEGDEAKELDRLKKELVYQQALQLAIYGGGVPLDILLISLKANVRDIKTYTLVHFNFEKRSNYYVIQRTDGQRYEFVNMDENGTILSIEPAIKAEEKLIRDKDSIIKENVGSLSTEAAIIVAMTGLLAMGGLWLKKGKGKQYWKISPY